MDSNNLYFEANLNKGSFFLILLERNFKSTLIAFNSHRTYSASQKLILKSCLDLFVSIGDSNQLLP